MTSAFDRLAAQAHGAIESIFGDAVDIDGIAGTAILIPDTNLALGGGVQLYNGAHLTIRSADFPDITVNSEVTHGDDEYILMELDDVDSAGIRKARLARR